jgi:hypothetical protein
LWMFTWDPGLFTVPHVYQCFHWYSYNMARNYYELLIYNNKHIYYWPLGHYIQQRPLLRNFLEPQRATGRVRRELSLFEKVALFQEISILVMSKRGRLRHVWFKVFQKYKNRNNTRIVYHDMLNLAWIKITGIRFSNWAFLPFPLHS